MKLNPKPMYRMSLCSNPIINPRWEILEDEKKKEIFNSPEWKLCKAFASQQDQYCDPDNTWYVKARFIDINKTTADCDDYKEHFFPDYIPIWCVNGRKQDNIINKSFS